MQLISISCLISLALLALCSLQCLIFLQLMKVIPDCSQCPIMRSNTEDTSNKQSIKHVILVFDLFFTVISNQTIICMMHRIKQKRFNNSSYISFRCVCFKYLFNFHSKLQLEYFTDMDVEVLTLQIHLVLVSETICDVLEDLVH